MLLVFMVNNSYNCVRAFCFKSKKQDLHLWDVSQVYLLTYLFTYLFFPPMYGKHRPIPSSVRAFPEIGLKFIKIVYTEGRDALRVNLLS